MPSREIRQEVYERLDDLYERHCNVPLPEDATFYEPGAGYRTRASSGRPHDEFAVAMVTVNGQAASAGEDEAAFALQSISKVFSYGQALQDRGRDHVLKHVGVEPSGDAFNSIVFDERHTRPYNPMVNAGAIVTTDLVQGRDPAEKVARTLATLRGYAGDAPLEVDERALERELGSADHNRAAAYLMRAQGMIGGDVEETLRAYLSQCTVKVTCRQLALMAATLANGGVNPQTEHVCLPRARVRDVLSVMYTCGMYNFAGEWAYEIGVPAKSGVSGGILCVIPGKLGLAVFSPGLDEYGNSIRGISVCQEISERLGLHIFATEDEDALLGRPAFARAE